MIDEMNYSNSVMNAATQKIIIIKRNNKNYILMKYKRLAL